MLAARAQSGLPDLTRPFVVRNDDGTWGDAVYYKVRDLRPGVGEFMDRHGGLCEIPLHRMRLIAFEDAPSPEPSGMLFSPTPEEAAESRAKATERRVRMTRSRKTQSQRQQVPASAAQVGLIRRLCRTLCTTELAAMQSVGARCDRLEQLPMWQASRLIDRLKGGR